MTRVAVLGGGAWGTALAIHLARSSASVALYTRREESAADLRSRRENRAYLPGCALPDSIEVTSDLPEALRGRSLVLTVAPAQATRDLLRRAAAHLESDADVAIASKGIEEGSGLLLPEVLQQVDPGRSSRAVILSGPSFAAEMARGDPTAIVAASTDPEAAGRCQRALSSRAVRVYTNGDPTGVAVAGALKNVVAIATGIADGMGLGLNTRAALITRGLAEMARLGSALGGRAATFAGLAGIGDLVLTCTGDLSRNRAVGIGIGRGRTLAEIVGASRSVAEGVATTRAALVRAARAGVEMPIATQVAAVLFDRRPAREALEDLLARPPKEEA